MDSVTVALGWPNDVLPASTTTYTYTEPESELHRELSQTTKRGNETLQPVRSAQSTTLVLQKIPLSIGCSSDYIPLSVGQVEEDEGVAESFDLDLDLSDGDSYIEYMKNLSPCSSIVTKVSETELALFDMEAVEDILISRNSLGLDGTSNLQNTQEVGKSSSGNAESRPRSNKTQKYEKRSTLEELENDFDDFHFQSLTETVRLGMTKIELISADSNKKTTLTLNRLADYVEEQLRTEILSHNINREQILHTLTVNHLLIYIYDHNNHRKLNYINQIRLFHLGRSYLADRGISDPRYFTLQFYLKDFRLLQSPCFNLFINDNFDDYDEYLQTSCPKMLLKSFVWRSAAAYHDVSATYAKTLFKKFRKVKSSIRNNIQVQDEERLMEKARGKEQKLRANYTVNAASAGTSGASSETTIAGSAIPNTGNNINSIHSKTHNHTHSITTKIDTSDNKKPLLLFKKMSTGFRKPS